MAKYKSPSDKYLDYVHQVKRVIKDKGKNKKVLHGQSAINKQIPIKHLQRKTIDFDYYVKDPEKQAREDLRYLRRKFKDNFILERAQHEGTIKIKDKKTGITIADYTKIPLGVQYVIINGKKYANLNFFKRHIEATLRDKSAKFRHSKDKNTLNRIKEYEKKYKNISNKEFKQSTALIEKYGKYKDTDKDRKLNWFDCFPFDPTRQDYPKRSTGIQQQARNTQIQQQISQQQELTQEQQKLKEQLDEQIKTYNEALKQREIHAGGIKAGYGRESQIQYNKYDEIVRDAKMRIDFLKQSSSMGEFGQKMTNARESQRVRDTNKINEEYAKAVQDKSSKAYKYEIEKLAKETQRQYPNNEVRIDYNKGEVKVYELPKKEQKAIQEKQYMSIPKDINSSNAYLEYDRLSNNSYINSKYGSSLLSNQRNKSTNQKVIISPKVDKVMDKFAGERGNKKTDDWYTYASKEYLPKYLEQIPLFAKDIVVGTAKGGITTGFYAGEKITGKKLKDNDFLKKWTNYNRDVPIYLDPNVQTWALTTAFVGAGAVASGTGKVATAGKYFTKAGTGAVMGYQGLQTIKNPTDKNIAVTSLMFLPSTIKITKNVYKATGSKYIAPDEVFSKQVLEQGRTFPESRNVPEMLEKFKRTDGEVSHATKHTPKKETEIAGGKQLRPEDKGLYVTPKGEGSPYFLDINKQGVETKYTLNPFKEISKNPQMWDIKTKGVERLPQEILEKAKAIQMKYGNKKAFEFINKWYEDKAITGKAYIPLRSELRQTAETQAVIPEGTKIIRKVEGNIINKVKGYEYYTILDGEVIPIRKFEIAEGKLGIKEFNKIKKEIEFAKQKETEYYKDYSGKKYETPYNKIVNPEYTNYNKQYKNSQSYYSTKEGYNPYPTGKYKPYQEYKSETPYPTETEYYDKYGTYEGYESYQPYTEYSPYKPTPPYTPYPTRPIQQKQRTLGYKVQSNRKVQAWRPIMQDEQGNIIYGDWFANQGDATNNGMLAVSESPATSFELQKGFVNLNEIRQDKRAILNRASMFRQIGRTFIEKQQFRNNSIPEQKSNYNWMQFLKKKNTYVY